MVSIHYGNRGLPSRGLTKLGLPMNYLPIYSFVTYILIHELPIYLPTYLPTYGLFKGILLKLHWGLFWSYLRK